jgi:antitoxin component of MazEF toxin-antitoxin module
MERDAPAADESSRGHPAMTIRIIRVGNALRVEIPDEIAAQISLSAGDLVEWTMNEAGQPQLSKKTTLDAPPKVDGSHPTPPKHLE